MEHKSQTYIFLLVTFFVCSFCQSGDKYLFTATPTGEYPIDDEYGKLSKIS